MTYKELLKSEYKNYTYEDYMCSQPMRDGEEIRTFLDEPYKKEEDKNEKA